ncbi:hypothetical protein MUN84_19030 [Hymenobacter sp. 5516J-16]|nr:hypothetical protein [Hymenobacter sp. 5516J-16]UOQ76599.1 hypothetical protein MUN84_19030 [Hymenobacter sp. 5516J-16]
MLKNLDKNGKTLIASQGNFQMPEFYTISLSATDRLIFLLHEGCKLE